MRIIVQRIDNSNLIKMLTGKTWNYWTNHLKNILQNWQPWKQNYKRKLIQSNCLIGVDWFTSNYDKTYTLVRCTSNMNENYFTCLILMSKLLEG